MAALTAASFTVTIGKKWVHKTKRYVVGKLVLADTADTYPDNGIPMPALNKFGLYRQIDVLEFFGASNSGETQSIAAPTATLVTDSTINQIEAGAHSYKVTIVTPEGESKVSAVSNAVTNDGTHTQNTITRPVGYTSRATGWNVYRTAAAADPAVPTNFLKVNASPVAIASATYADIIPDASRSGAAPTVDTTKGEYLLRYDKTNHKLFIHEEEASAAGGPLLEADATEKPGRRSWDFFLVGW